MTNTKINYNLFDVIKFPLVTEKSTKQSEGSNQVAFVVRNDATKPQIKQAIELAFNVKVKAVNTLVQKGKEKRFRGRVGHRSDIKKAYVTLIAGQTIDIGSGI